MNILVTGGAGFIGSHLIEELINKEGGCTIIVVDDLSTGKKENLPKDDRIKFIIGDVSRKEVIADIFRNYQIDYIYHLAAIASVQDSLENPQMAHMVNFDSTLLLLEQARLCKSLKRFVYAGSAAVYGNEPNVPCSEEGYCNPISPYGIDKYASERYIIAYFNLFNIPVTVYRFFNIYGTRQNSSSPYSGVMSIFMNRFRDVKPQVTIYGNGDQTRDFVYVVDLVKVLSTMPMSDFGIGQVINIATGNEASLKDVVAAFESITGKKASIIFAPQRSGDIVRSVGNNRKLLETGIINSFTSITEGIRNSFY